MSFITPRVFPPPHGFPHFVDHSIGREEISIQAMSLVGVPYRWGGNTPQSGFDCSGLVRYVIERAAHIELPRTTAEMSVRGESIEPDDIAPGDLIFFNTTGRPHSHVGIYIGKLQFVNAPSTGGTVRLDYLTNPYWAKHFDGIRRVAPPKAAPTPFDTPTYEASRPPEPAPAPAPALTPPAAAPAQPVYAAAPAQPIYTAPLPATQSTQRAAVTSADSFEPPPPGMAAARQQARAADATSPALAAAGGTDNASSAQAYSAPRGDNNGGITAANASPDPIDSAADAFEPPPPTASAAERQAQLGSPGTVQVIRASTSPGSPAAAATSTSDDPIARFANSGY